LVHDEHNLCGIGDKVLIEESRPLSARKRFILKEILYKAPDAAQYYELKTIRTRKEDQMRNEIELSRQDLLKNIASRMKEIKTKWGVDLDVKDLTTEKNGTSVDEIARQFTEKLGFLDISQKRLLAEKMDKAIIQSSSSLKAEQVEEPKSSSQGSTPLDERDEKAT
jgi:hypothetical protein